MSKQERSRFTAYITKYALTEGIIAKEVEDCFDIAGDMIKAGEHTFFHGKDWHYTEASAIDRAETMRADKLASIDKQRKRIAALKFG